MDLQNIFDSFILCIQTIKINYIKTEAKIITIRQ